MPVKHWRVPWRVLQHRHGRNALAGQLVLTAVVLLPWLLGGAHPIVNVGASLLLLAAWGLQFGFSGPPSFNLFTGLMALAVVWTALQWVPLPLALWRFLAPGSHRVLALQHAPQEWVKQAMDVPQLAHGWLQLVGLLAAAQLGSTWVHSRTWARRLSLSLSLGGLGCMLIGTIQSVLGTQRPYGLFGNGMPTLFCATFINPNHLAGYLGMVSLVALGWSLREREPWRMVYLSAAVACGVGVIVSMSRGGLIAYGLALVAFFVLWQSNADPCHRVSRRRLSILAAGTFVAVALWLALWVPWVHEVLLLEPEPLHKLRLYSAIPSLWRDFWLFGVGKGVMSAVYGRYAPLGLPHLTITHLENEWLQLGVDFGPFVGCLLLLGGLTWVGRSVPWRQVRYWRSSEAGCVCALGFLALHNCVDFNLELSAVALPAVLLLVNLPDAASAKLPSGSVKWSGWAAFAVMVMAVCAASYPTLTHSLSQDTARLQSSLATVGVGFEERLHGASEAMAWHPADYFLPLMWAQHRLQVDGAPAAALQWINRSMALAPHDAASHFLAGSALVALGAVPQATSEMRVTAALDPTAMPAIANHLWAAGGGPAYEVMWAEGASPALRTFIARDLLNRECSLEALEVARGTSNFAALVDQDANFAWTVMRAELVAGHPDAAAEAALRARQVWPRWAQPWDVQAQALQRLGQFEQAYGLLLQGLRQVSDPSELLQRATAYLLAHGRFSEARTLCESVLGPARTTTVAGLLLLGQIDESAGLLGAARQHYEQARLQAPDDPVLHGRLQNLQQRQARR